MFYPNECRIVFINLWPKTLWPTKRHRHVESFRHCSYLPECRFERHRRRCYTHTKWAPTAVISRVITPLIGVKKTQLPNYEAIYRGPITPFTSRGHLAGVVVMSLRLRQFVNARRVFRQQTTHFMSGAQIAGNIGCKASSKNSMEWIAELESY